nr:hypothetical protein 16 [Paracoccaceae bacterium]
MIGQILSSVTGLATSWLDSKAQQKLLETEIKKKQLTGAVGGAAAVYVLSDQQRREKLKDCAEKMRANCKTKWNTNSTVPTQ